MIKDTLFYDGQCPLCAKEIQWLKEIHDGSLAFCDIHSISEETLGINKQAMLKVLHLQTSDKKWLLGLSATIRSWSHTPYGFLFKPLGWPILRLFANGAYTLWASKRYKSRYHCNKCTTPERTKT